MQEQGLKSKSWDRMLCDVKAEKINYEFLFHKKSIVALMSIDGKTNAHKISLRNDMSYCHFKYLLDVFKSNIMVEFVRKFPGKRRIPVLTNKGKKIKELLKKCQI